MTYQFRIGEAVTIAPPYTNLPVILEMQRHAWVSSREIVGDDGTYVQVELDSAAPEYRFHMVPVEQVRHGWIDVRTL
jgi:hypothetical protein